MKKADLQKLKENSAEELKSELLLIKDNLWQLKLDLANGKVKNVRQVHNLKKKVAVINTLLNR